MKKPGKALVSPGTFLQEATYVTGLGSCAEASWWSKSLWPVTAEEAQNGFFLAVVVHEPRRALDPQLGRHIRRYEELRDATHRIHRHLQELL